MQTIRQTTAAETAELRHRVLRPHEELSALSGDQEPSHFVGVFDGEVLVATGNVRRDPAPWLPGAPAWRLRGMATEPDRRGEGLGTLVLEALLAHCRDHGGGLVWANARTPAISFYERAGMQTRGEVWEDPDIGPHIQVWTVVASGPD